MLTGKGESPILTSVTAAYQQRNIRPEVASITVHPPGVVFQKPFSSGETEIAGFDAETIERRVPSAAALPPAVARRRLGRRTYQKGLQTLIWKAEDDNGDELTLRRALSSRRRDHVEDAEGGLTDTISGLGHGLGAEWLLRGQGRRLRSQVQSRRDGAEGRARERQLRCRQHRAGRRDGRDPPRRRMPSSCRSTCATRIPSVTRVEYSVDSQRWQSAFPQDGILDARREQFTLRLDAAMAGRTLVVRATDAMNNVGSGELVLK